METTFFYIVLFFHLSCLILAFGSVMVTDLHGLLWKLNRIPFSHALKVSGTTEKFIWGGWIGMVATGIVLLVLKGVVDNLMVIKIFFVALLGIDGAFLHVLRRRIVPYSEEGRVPKVLMFRLMLALGVSQIGWWGAILVGFLHRQVQDIIDWPETPSLLIIISVSALFVTWIIGEAVLRD